MSSSFCLLPQAVAFVFIRVPENPQEPTQGNRSFLRSILKLNTNLPRPTSELRPTLPSSITLPFLRSTTDSLPSPSFILHLHPLSTTGCPPPYPYSTRPASSPSAQPPSTVSFIPSSRLPPSTPSPRKDSLVSSSSTETPTFLRLAQVRIRLGGSKSRLSSSKMEWKSV